MGNRLAELQQLLLEEPNDAFLRYAIALEHAAMGQLKTAIAETENLIADQPDYLGAYYQLGQWLEQDHQPEKALHIYHLGAVLAQKLNKLKTLGELNEAIWMLED